MRNVPEVDDLAEAAEARVVHEHVQVPELVEGAAYQRLDLALLGDIAELGRRGLAGDGLDLLRRAVQAPLVEVGDHHARTLFGAAARGREADPAARRRRDQHGTTVEELATARIGGNVGHRSYRGSRGSPSAL
jgi:hypothetical protein